MKSKKINFVVDHLDPKGQGVDKKGDKITFIPKVLPSEAGEAEIVSGKKGVQFAQITQINKKSPIRTESECIHYDKCPGCHYLHTSHDQEMIFKKSSLEQIWNRFPKIKTHFNLKEGFQAPTRFHYRNRIQLHYNTIKRQFGYQTRKDDILPISQCLLPLNSITTIVSTWSINNKWLSELPAGQPAKGHVEFYDKNNDGDVTISWNQSYADSGFTQVNPVMNERFLKYLTNCLSTLISQCPHKHVLDLFGGNGNLSKGLKDCEVLVIDLPKSLPMPNTNQTYFSLDLYSPEAIENLQLQTPHSPDLIILDPPRSGFTDLDRLVNHYHPQYLLYVSCDAFTQTRDLEKIMDQYSLEELTLWDFFPGTFHFETVAILKRKNK